MFSHYNVDFIPSTEKNKSDEEIEEMFRKNREDCKENNLNYIQKRIK